MRAQRPRASLRRRLQVGVSSVALALVAQMPARADQPTPPAGPDVAATHAAPDPAPARWQRQIGLGYGLYRESGMSLRGPEALLGLRWQPDPGQRYELEWLGSSQRYDSDATGSKNGVPYYETRLQGLYDWTGAPDWLQPLSVGWRLHYGYNDLRGSTSKQRQGYERITQQLWLPLRWQTQTRVLDAPQTLDLELGWLLYGVQTSKLSQVGPSYADARNIQRSGLYLQLRAHASATAGKAFWEPSLRIVRIGNSNEVSAGTGHLVTEPASLFIHFGVSRVW